MPASSVRDRAALAGALDPIIVIDSWGVIQSASDSVERVFGWTSEELTGCNVSILMPEPHRSAHDGYLARYRETGRTNILNNTRGFDAVRKDGTVFSIEIAVSRVEIPGRADPYFVGILRDVSARHRAEQEWRLLRMLVMTLSSEKNLDAALSLVLKEICSTTGWDYGEAWLPQHDEGGCLRVRSIWHEPDARLEVMRNASFECLFDEDEGLPGRVLHSKRAEWVADLDSASSATFRRRELAVGAGLKAGFAVPILAGEQVVAVLAFYSRIARAQDEHLLELVTAASAPLGAVIDRRRIEHALLESEQRFRDMLNQVELLAIMLDLKGGITFIDQFLLDLTGWSERDVIGRDWFDLFVPADRREQERNRFRAAIKDGSLRPQQESEILIRDGEHRVIAWSTSLLRDQDGRVIGATGLGVDVTEQRRIEAELAHYRQHLEHLVAERTAELEASHEQLRMADRLASIGTLAAGLGHDMCNVLLPVRAQLNALRAAPLSEAAQAHVQAISGSVSYLQQLADGLHFLAMDPEGDDSGDGATDLHQWWSQTGPLLTKAAPKHVRVSASIPNGLPLVGIAPHRLTQAALNLVVNAGEAIPPPGDGDPDRLGVVRVSAELDDDGGPFLHLSISDNGRGMSDEVRHRCSEMFFTTKSRGLGTGLGLPLVHKVAAAAGGSLMIDSTPGEGTTVIMTLPILDRAGSPGDPGGGSLNAVITLRDGRAAALIQHILEADGANAAQGDEPGSSDIWVVEPTESARRTAQIWRESHPTSRLVLFGPIDADAQRRWGALHPVIIRNPRDFDDIRAALSAATLST